MHQTLTQLTTIDGETLMSKPLTPIRFVVQSLVPQGLHILAGAPKVGKSWLALWLCLQVAKGDPVWSFPTEKGTTLYLCPEDSEARIQNRLFDITEDAPPDIHFATLSHRIGSGLEQQIETFVTEHPDTALIVIDTLQKVRTVSNDNAYANDYRDLGILKTVADKLGVAIVLIHHLRKQKDSDPMNMVSGTTGITGAVDSTFVLEKDRRSSGSAVLFCSGRDIEYRELILSFDTLTHLWELQMDSVENPEVLLEDDLLFLCDWLRSLGSFTGTPTELFDALKPLGLKIKTANVLSKKLVQNQKELATLGVFYSSSRSNGRRTVSITSAGSDGSDDKTEMPPYPKSADPVDPAGTEPAGAITEKEKPLAER